MKVQILDEATADLADGYCFYERQAEGLGEYFLDTLWSDIHSLRLFAESTPSITVTTASFLGDSRMPFITVSKVKWLAYVPYWIAVGIRAGSRRN